MSQAVIMTEGLMRRFGDVLAVDGLTFEVEAGEVFGFLGHNGAGKTTTVRLLNGVLAPSGGEARVLGLDPAQDGPALRLRTGVLTETPSLEERLTARENLSIHAELFGVPPADVAQRINTMLETFGLAERADENVGGYSKGMKQRLALARALLHEPELLFLDEPTGGLDPVATRQVHRLIQELSQERGRTVFLCTHNLAEAQKLCDRVAVLEQGRVVALGTPTALARQFAARAQLEIEVDAWSDSQSAEILKLFPDFKLVVLDREGEATITVQGVIRERIPELVAGLVQGGARIYRVSQQEPSLEDVYFALYESSSRSDSEHKHTDHITEEIQS